MFLKHTLWISLIGLTLFNPAITHSTQPPLPPQQQHPFQSYPNASGKIYLDQSQQDVRSDWPESIKFAVAYYPSQWPKEYWSKDASRMANASITHVRISEFDWSVLEPSEGNYDWSLLDESIDVLQQYGLKVILGTPTATPPSWIVQKYDILAVDEDMQTRRFGSRRHYSFSSPDYLRLSKGIVKAMAERYGDHDAIDAWQLDNEFGNSRGARSFDENATKKFREWLKNKYGTIQNLNERQGRVFWSSQFDSFDEILPPTLEVEESNPALRIDFFHFSSDQLIEYSAVQAETIREVAKERGYRAKPITTNFMGFEFSFDHYKFMQQTGIDFATWDSYPIGNAEQFGWASEEEKVRYARTGRPDHQALIHSLFRGIAGVRYNNNPRGPWGVMELQPGGPVNWASSNPSPSPGVLRLWLHDMIAHGSSLNSIFRWRQVPYAQEQMHTGMLRPDDVFDTGYGEQQMTVLDVERLNDAKVDLSSNTPSDQPRIALVFDFASHWFIEAQPQSGHFQTSTWVDYTFQYPELVSNWYSALRRLALDVDVIGPSTNLSNYDLLVIPTMVNITAEFDQALRDFKGDVIVGPKTSSKVDPLSIPSGLPPAKGALRDRIPLKVVRVESIRKGGLGDQVRLQGELCSETTECVYPVEIWSEWLECERDGKKANEFILANFEGYRQGAPAMCSHVEDLEGEEEIGKRTTYIGWYTKSPEVLLPIFTQAAKRRNIKTLFGKDPAVKNDLGNHVRFARRGNALFAFNYDDKHEAQIPLPKGEGKVKLEMIIGGIENDDRRIAKNGVNIYHIIS